MLFKPETIHIGSQNADYLLTTFELLQATRSVRLVVFLVLPSVIPSV